MIRDRVRAGVQRGRLSGQHRHVRGPVLRASAFVASGFVYSGCNNDLGRDHRLVGGRVRHQGHKAIFVPQLKEGFLMNKIKGWGCRCAAPVAGLSALAFAPMSMAAIDVTSVTTALTDAGTAVATVGAAVLVVIVGVAAYKYIRRAL